MITNFDVIVIGLGHAGCEAALAAAGQGLNTLAVTMKKDRIAVMSCNPAIGGTAKGHLVRELDALGGSMGRAADMSGTHFITLNASKGPAVRATRVMCDRDGYATAMQSLVNSQPCLTIVEGEVSELLTEDLQMRGVRLKDGRSFHSNAVVVTTGTFLQALMHVGAQKEMGGRLGDSAATGLSVSLRSLGIELGRFKTGTPARLKRSSIDFSKCELQPGDAHPSPFSQRTAKSPFPLREQVDCYVTHTNEHTHSILRDNLHASPLYQGHIVGRGPRYCPSLEDKVVRFAGKNRHTVFLEPEGVTSDVVYPAGLSTSMPAEVQLSFLRSIRGLENVEVLKYGYAVEYDYAPPTQLKATLETKRFSGLFFAGQLNGPSGYEEAAFQGLMAGINAGLMMRRLDPLVLGRQEAHGGVLLDELITRGVDEPFRMLTSRSEHRLTLREGNARYRLQHHGHRVGLITDAEMAQTSTRQAQIRAELERLQTSQLLTALRRPENSYASLAAIDPQRPDLEPEVQGEVEVEARYAPYVEQLRVMLARQGTEHDTWRFPAGFQFVNVKGLSREVSEKLTKTAPENIGQARRVQGVTPTAIGLLLVHLKRARETQRST